MSAKKTVVIIAAVLVFVIAAGAVIVGSIGAYVYFNIPASAGKGPAWPQVPAEPFAKVWKQDMVFLLGAGDSITEGFGALNGQSYFDRLIANPADDCCDMKGKTLTAVFPKFMSRNIAVSKTVSKQHLEAIQKFPVQPDKVFGIVVITTGGNDLIHSYGKSKPAECAMYGATLEEAKPWISNFRNRLDSMVFAITEKFPGGCEIFIANIYDPTDGCGNTNKLFTGFPAWSDGLKILDEYNKAIADCDKQYRKVHLVDIYTPFLGHGINSKKFWLKNYHPDDPYYWYDSNIEDPNPRGYDAIRRAFLLKMVEVFAN
jgi:hypothetical protein